MMNLDADLSTSMASGARHVVSLDGEWDFSFEGQGSTVNGRLIVPGVWQPHFPELRNSSGTGTYERMVSVPALGAGQRLALFSAQLPRQDAGGRLSLVQQRPAQNDQFQATTDAFANRASWSFSPHGDADRTGRGPRIVSEFGVWGLPHPSDILEKDGSEPWWFESGHD